MFIESKDIIPIDEHFRVIAGPGAGKTTFLVNHIKNIHKQSKLLSSLRKVACITYTNSGVQSIKTKLGTEFNSVEVSTIHSFLYRHVLKPYGSFLGDEYNLDITKVTGHDEHYVERGKVNSWIEEHSKAKELKHPFSQKQLLKIDYIRLERWLKELRYQMLECGEIVLTAGSEKSRVKDKDGKTYTLREECVKILQSDTLNYKKLYWAEGKIDHDDVLFLSFKLIKKHPFILQILHAKFPYFLIDEFQDSSPLQVKLINEIGQTKTKVGIIGDHAQAIYAFQGADPNQLDEFYLPGIKDYRIKDNHRSTGKIVGILNHIREDIKQKSHTGEGERPVLLVGDRQLAYDKAQNSSSDGNLKILYRRNKEASAMQNKIDYADADLELLGKFSTIDSNSKRRNAILCSLQAVELAKIKRFDKAIRKIHSIMPEIYDPFVYRGKALNGIHFLLSSNESYENEPLLSFYDLVQSTFALSLSRLQVGGGPRAFYSEFTYNDLAICVEIQDHVKEHITIHQAKGAGFENVLLILENEKDLEFLIKPDLTNEEHRVYYVALSRAKKGLFVNVPTLGASNKGVLENMFDIKYMGELDFFKEVSD